MENDSFQCFCGESASDREALISHNMSSHGWDEDESRRKVMEKYPEQR